jgi:hypothetical protein
MKKEHAICPLIDLTISRGKTIVKKGVEFFLNVEILTLWRRNFLLNFSTPCI